MKDERDVKVLAIVGMSGSGKSVVVDYLSEKGIPKIYFGGIVYQAQAEAGIEQSPENDKKFREESRQKWGKDWVLQRAIVEADKLIEAGQKRIVLDGLYSWTEYKILKQKYPTELTVIAVVVPRKLRYKRVAKRPKRPFNGQEIRERDYSEVDNLEKGGPIAMADYYLLNDGTIAELHDDLERVLGEIEF